MYITATNTRQHRQQSCLVALLSTIRSTAAKKGIREFYKELKIKQIRSFYKTNEWQVYLLYITQSIVFLESH